MAAPEIFCALDTDNVETALKLAGMMERAGCGIKLGLEYFNAQGPAGVKTVMERYPDLPLFLDLKFHDIPNTVAGAVRAVTTLGVSYINVHATGGSVMMRAARDAAGDAVAKAGIKPPKILAVTLLTSLDALEIEKIGFEERPEIHVEKLALLAQESGMDGVVCSSHEVETLRKACGPDFVLMVPGIRPAGSADGDQKRVMTPKDALDKGATHLVIGRPITQADNPEQAARDLLAEAHTSRSNAA